MATHPNVTVLLDLSVGLAGMPAHEGICLPENTRQVVKLKQLTGQSWRFLVETTNEVYPRYLIGVTGRGARSLKLSMCMGAEWNARRHWDLLEAHDAATPALPGLDAGGNGSLPS